MVLPWAPPLVVLTQEICGSVEPSSFKQHASPSPHLLGVSMGQESDNNLHSTAYQVFSIHINCIIQHNTCAYISWFSIQWENSRRKFLQETIVSPFVFSVSLQHHVCHPSW